MGEIRKFGPRGVKGLSMASMGFKPMGQCSDGYSVSEGGLLYCGTLTVVFIHSKSTSTG